MDISLKTFKHIEHLGEDVFHNLVDKMEYVSEPSLSLIQASFKEPVNTVLHPLDTSQRTLKTVWSTILRSTEVVNDGLDYLMTKPIPKRNSMGKPALEKRQDRAYSGAIKHAVDKAIENSPSAIKAGPNNHDDLEQLSQVGPAIIRQLHAAGIYKFKQIANPTEEEKKALQAFKKRGAFTVWKEESKQFLASKHN